MLKDEHIKDESLVYQVLSTRKHIGILFFDIDIMINTDTFDIDNTVVFDGEKWMEGNLF